MPAFVPLASIPSDSAEPLGEHLARAGRLPVLHGLALVVQMLSVLQSAHSRGQVHGALSLDSLLITHCGGIQVCEPAGPAREPAPSTPPEQIAGAAADARSDIYSAAVVAYELLAGTSPFQGSGRRAAWPPRAARHDLPIAIEPVFRKALAQDPGLRFASAQEFSRALQEAIGTPLWNRAVPAPARSGHGPITHRRSTPRRRAGLVMGGVGAALALVVAFGWMLLQAPDAAAPLASSSVATPMVELRESLDATESLEPLEPVAQVAQVAPGFPGPDRELALQAVSESEQEPVADQEPVARQILREAPTRARAAATRLNASPQRTAKGSAPERRTRVADLRSPASRCSSPSSFARELCVSLRCATFDFRAHPTCVRLHAEAQARSRLGELRGGS